MATLLALTGIGAPLAHAVQGAAPSTAAAWATVKIEIAGNPQAAPGEVRERTCSGALLNESWVISATSCFAETPGAEVSAGPPMWLTRATVGRLELPVTRPEGATVMWPGKTENVAATAPAVGDALTVTGFGRTADEIVPDLAHAASYTVEAVAAGTVDIEAADDGAAICKGDAGGPALRATADGGVELVAIHHTAYQGGCLGATSTRQGATETRVDTLRAWIAEQIAPPVPAAPPVKHISTVNGGQVHEAASENGWKNIGSLVTTAGPLAVAALQ